MARGAGVAKAKAKAKAKTLAEQRTALALRETKLNVQEAKRFLTKLLKHFPHLWVDLSKHAIALGYDNPEEDSTNMIFIFDFCSVSLPYPYHKTHP